PMLSRPQGEIPFPTNPSIYPFSLTLHAHFLTPFPTFRPSPVVAAPARVSRPRPPASPPAPSAMSKQGGKAKPLKQAKVAEKDYDENDLAYLQKKKDEQKGPEGAEGQGRPEGCAGRIRSQEEWEEMSLPTHS
uniref:Uncharacterized protein n=1 Tax=Aegilops tauschii subsp. strangulata TaxID=200361 RepID=A0A453STQ5_AEGTS